MTALDPSFAPDPDLKGSYYRRLEDVRRALDSFGTKALPANSPAQFVAYYFGAEKLAKAIVGINKVRLPKSAFRQPVDLAETKAAARDLKLQISQTELDALFEHQTRVSQPSSAITIRNRLTHDFGPTQVWHIHQHAPRLVLIMIRFIANIDLALQHLRTEWAKQPGGP